MANQPVTWRALLADAPFRGTEVKEEWPYLWAIVAGPASSQFPRRWCRDSLRRVRIGTWKRARDRAHDKAVTLAAATCPQSRRATAWNTYIVSLFPYLAHVALPTMVQEHATRRDLSPALRHDRPPRCPPPRPRRPRLPRRSMGPLTRGGGSISA